MSARRFSTACVELTRLRLGNRCLQLSSTVIELRDSFGKGAKAVAAFFLRKRAALERCQVSLARLFEAGEFPLERPQLPLQPRPIPVGECRCSRNSPLKEVAVGKSRGKQPEQLLLERIGRDPVGGAALRLPVAVAGEARVDSGRARSAHALLSRPSPRRNDRSEACRRRGSRKAFERRSERCFERAARSAWACSKTLRETSGACGAGCVSPRQRIFPT